MQGRDKRKEVKVMVRNGLVKVVERAVNDRSFLTSLKEDFDEAINGYALTSEEACLFILLLIQRLRY